MLHEFLAANTQEIIARTRAKVAGRRTVAPTEAELRNGVPLFLSQLIDLLRLVDVDSAAIEKGAALHGTEQLAMGFTLSQVVHGYGDVCQVVTEIANEANAPITAAEFHTFNRCLDDAIAQAVTEYQRHRDASIAFQETERLAVLAHELRNRLNTAMLSFEVLQQGAVGIHGATGHLHKRSLRGMRDLINNALAGVRLESGLGVRRRVSVAELVKDAAVEGSLDAELNGFGLAVSSVAVGIDVEVDPQLVSAAISNLLQNAFKFSHTHGQVSLRATATAERVRIEVEDECGGLPPGTGEDLFLPFSQRGEKRTGLGLGLTISRKGVEAMGGTLEVRDLPGKGCVFSIELPRLPEA